MTLHFADGSSAEATSRFSASFGTRYYHLDGLRNSNVTGATAQWDSGAYPNYTFTVTASLCLPEPVTYSVNGAVTQRGNEKPVAGLTVCLMEAELCTTTDVSGSFSMSGVEDETYALTTNGSSWKPQTNTVTVSGDDVYVDIVQNKGAAN